jgi:hypothetical protein
MNPRISACALLLSTSSGLADPLTFRCEGKLWALERGVFGQEVTKSLIVDMAEGSVSGSIGSFSITKVEKDQIDFSAPLFEGGKKTGMWMGWFDRITGELDLHAWRDPRGAAVFIVYNLTCAPARPLF